MTTTFVPLPEALRHPNWPRKVHKTIKALGCVWSRDEKGWAVPEEYASAVRRLLEEEEARVVSLPGSVAVRSLDPRLKVAADAVKTAEATLSALKEHERLLKVSLVLEARPWSEAGCRLHGDELFFGGAKCSTSPVGHCVYDDTEDPRHDSCLFCREPRERA